MRYFFHIRTADGLIPDGEGTELPSLERARAEAIACAKEFAVEFPPGGDGVRVKSIEVADEVGAVFSAPIFDEARRGIPASPVS
jgi:hypothetical protein